MLCTKEDTNTEFERMAKTSSLTVFTLPGRCSHSKWTVSQRYNCQVVLCVTNPEVIARRRQHFNVELLDYLNLAHESGGVMVDAHVKRRDS